MGLAIFPINSKCPLPFSWHPGHLLLQEAFPSPPNSIHPVLRYLYLSISLPRVSWTSGSCLVYFCITGMSFSAWHMADTEVLLNRCAGSNGKKKEKNISFHPNSSWAPSPLACLFLLTNVSGGYNIVCCKLCIWRSGIETGCER